MGATLIHGTGAKRQILFEPPHVFSWPPQVGVANSEYGVAKNLYILHQLQVKFILIYSIYLKSKN